MPALVLRSLNYFSRWKASLSIVFLFKLMLLHLLMQSDTDSDVAVLVGVGVSLCALGLMEHLVAVLVFLIFVCKKKQGEDLLCYQFICYFEGKPACA